MTSSSANGAQNNHFINLDVEPTGAGTGITAIYLDKAKQILFNAPYIESNAIGYNITSNASRIMMNGGEFVSNTTYTDNGNSTTFMTVDIEDVVKNKLASPTYIQDLNTQDATLPNFTVFNNTNFAHNSLDFVKFSLLNSSDSSNLLNLSNAGTGALIYATSTQGGGFVIDRNFKTGIGTTSPYAQLSISNTRSSTINTPLLAIASTTGGTSTSTLMVVLANGNVGIASSSPTSKLTVTGNIWQQGKYAKFGDSTSLYSCINLASSCVELDGDDNTTGGVYYQVGNRNSGSSAYGGLSMINDLGYLGNNASYYAGIFLNSSTYNDTTFGTLNSVPNSMQLVNTMGAISIQASSTGGIVPSYIEFAVDGLNTGSADARLDQRGFGIGTTTPQWPLQIASSTKSQLTFTSNTTDSPISFRSIGNHLYIASSSLTTFATSSISMIDIDSSSGTGTGLSIGSTSPFATLAVNPVAGQFSNQFVVGSSTNTNFKIDNSGHIFAPNITTSASLQTGIVCISSTGELINDSVACVASSMRFKEDIKSLNTGLNEVLQLRPVSYLYRKDFNGALQSNPNYNGQQVGFIAEEVKNIDPRLVVVETGGEYKGEPHTVRYENMVALVTQGLQDFYKLFQNLVAKVSGLESKINEQQKQLDSLQEQINKLKK
jgi:hypothetical protein